MKNEYAKLGFIRTLLGVVESYTDVTNKLPAKVYLNYIASDFCTPDQKAVLAELKKRQIISNFKFDASDFVITKPSRSGIIGFLNSVERMLAQPVVTAKTDNNIGFNEHTSFITMGMHDPCPIPINTNQYFLCKLLFKEKFGTPVTETDIVDLADWAKDTKRSVYDSMRAVNERIERYFGIKKFIRWKTGRVWIDYKQN